MAIDVSSNDGTKTRRNAEGTIVLMANDHHSIRMLELIGRSLSTKSRYCVDF